MLPGNEMLEHENDIQPTVPELAGTVVAVLELIVDLDPLVVPFRRSTPFVFLYPSFAAACRLAEHAGIFPHRQVHDRAVV